MIKRYDISKDEMVDLTQEHFDFLEKKRFNDLILHYKRNSPNNFKNFREHYILTNQIEVK